MDELNRVSLVADIDRETQVAIEMGADTKSATCISEINFTY